MVHRGPVGQFKSWIRKKLRFLGHPNIARHRDAIYRWKALGLTFKKERMIRNRVPLILGWLRQTALGIDRAEIGKIMKMECLWFSVTAASC